MTMVRDSTEPEVMAQSFLIESTTPQCLLLAYSVVCCLTQGGLNKLSVPTLVS